MIKVAIVGTHCVGKTTLASEFAAEVTRRGVIAEIVPEVARECPLHVNEEAPREAFYWILARQLQLEVEKSTHADILICDRSVLDNYIYYVRRFGTDGEDAEALHTFCKGCDAFLKIFIEVIPENCLAAGLTYLISGTPSFRCRLLSPNASYNSRRRNLVTQRRQRTLLLFDRQEEAHSTAGI